MAPRTGKKIAADVTAAEWKKARKEYITSNVTYETLSNKHNISYAVIVKRGNEENWVTLRSEQNDLHIRQQRSGLLLSKIKNVELDADVRSRYSKDARALAHEVMQRLEALKQRSTVNSGILIQLVATLRKCQEIEFTARGMATQLNSTTIQEHGSWSDFLEKVRSEKGLPDRPNPFRLVANTGNAAQQLEQQDEE